MMLVLWKKTKKSGSYHRDIKKEWERNAESRIDRRRIKKTKACEDAKFIAAEEGPNSKCFCDDK